MQRLKIAILDAVRNRSAAAARVLVSDGYECDIFGSVAKWKERLHAEHVDLLMLDASNDGAAEIVRYARSSLHPDLPILLVANNGDMDPITRALAAGASDYLCRPIRPAELKTRVGVLLARAYPERMANERVQHGEFVFDTHAHRLMRDNEPVNVTRREFELALLLFTHLGQPISRTTIGEAVWKMDGDTLSRTIDTHISRVRRKLRLQPDNGYILAQVYGYGYRLEHVGKAK